MALAARRYATRISTHAVLAVSAVVGVFGCARQPNIDVAHLSCQTDENCPSGYVCTKPAPGICVRPGDLRLDGGGPMDAARRDLGDSETSNPIDQSIAVDVAGALGDGGGLDSTADKPMEADLWLEVATGQRYDGAGDWPGSTVDSALGDAPVPPVDGSRDDIRVPSAGGAPGSGGVVTTGGASGIGGAMGSGGANGTGGSSGTGGTASGGTTAAGGAAGTGTGGATSTGGTIGTGGTSSTGGTKANGSPCSVGTECTSSYCADGVCCDKACGGCYACLADLTGSQTGKCMPATAGSNPHTTCAVDSPPCGHDGTCDGAGACRFKPATTACGSESCTGNTHTPPAYCTGSGTCSPVTGSTCQNGLACGTTQCKSSCTTDVDCATGYACPSAGSTSCTKLGTWVDHGAVFASSPVGPQVVPTGPCTVGDFVFLALTPLSTGVQYGWQLDSSSDGDSCRSPGHPYYCKRLIRVCGTTSPVWNTFVECTCWQSSGEATIWAGYTWQADSCATGSGYIAESYSCE